MYIVMNWLSLFYNRKNRATGRAEDWVVTASLTWKATALLIVHRVGCFSNSSLVLETQNVSGELWVPSPRWKLEVPVLVSVKKLAAVRTEQINSAPRAKAKAAQDFLSGALREGTASSWVGPPTSIEVIGHFRWGSLLTWFKFAAGWH